jgi:hypothetical protein
MSGNVPRTTKTSLSSRFVDDTAKTDPSSLFISKSLYIKADVSALTDWIDFESIASLKLLIAEGRPLKHLSRCFDNGLNSFL